jgi:HD-like signal output (HDOD) protein
MLMDAGMVVLNRILETDYIALVKECGDEERLAETERKALGTDHVEVAAELGRRWLFPEGLTDSIRHHHTGLSPDGRVHWDGAILRAARTLQRDDRAARPLEESVASLPRSIVTALDLASGELRDTCARCRKEAADARQVLALAS